jgi:hypothetical protein
MTVRVEWDNDEKKVVLFHIDPGWTWDDMFNATHQLYALFESVDHPVDSIICVEELITIPKLLTINTAKMSTDRHPKTRHIVVVTNSRLVRTLVGMLKRMKDPLALKMRFALSIEEAREILLKAEA